MTSLERGKVALALQARAGGTPTVLTLDKALTAGSAVAVSGTPGGGLARELARDFGIRKMVAAESRQQVQGIDEVLEALGMSGHRDRVTLLPFRSSDQVFSLFVRDRDERVLGVIQLTAGRN